MTSSNRSSIHLYKS